MIDGIEITGPIVERSAEILSDEALAFVADLHRRFNPKRRVLLAARAERQLRIDAGEMPAFLTETRDIREADWLVASIPADLMNRRVEITGPVERKMMINALNSGAKVFMADFEDSSTPSWTNTIEGQANLIDAHNRTISFENPDGKRYELNDETATLLVRPRGWHLDEKHFVVDGEPISAAIFDCGMYLFHSAKLAIEAGSGPYFYLPKLENHLEARLWNDVFVAAQEALGIPKGTIRATVLIETVLAAFEMDEILYELRDHSAGLNAGRWDYIFSVIKKFRNRRDLILPDRSQITMTVPFMRAYTELLVKTCHRRGAHAMGGMAAFIPNRRDPEVTERALTAVRNDKLREANDGFDGTWVAHPDLVGTAMKVFDDVLGDRPNQIDRQRSDIDVSAEQLVDISVDGGRITEQGVRTNIRVGIEYMASWLRGTGAAALYNLMEDAATAEISRSQIWQWVHNGATLDDGRRLTADLVDQITEDEMQSIRLMVGEEFFAAGRYEDSRQLFETVAIAADFQEFLTLPAYELID